MTLEADINIGPRQSPLGTLWGTGTVRAGGSTSSARRHNRMVPPGLSCSFIASMMAAATRPAAGLPGASWVGPLPHSYGGACVDLANHVGDLHQCQALCTSTSRCNAMNWGLQPQGCSLRHCPPAHLQPAGGVIPDCHGYYCNVSRADGFCDPAPPPPPSVVLRSAFGNGMVLQANDPGLSISGTVPNGGGSRVTVALDGTAVVLGTAVVDDDGAFTVGLGAQKTSMAEHTLTVAAVAPASGAVATAVTLTGVLFGEVFLCSGQSNMGLSVSQSSNASEEIAAAHWPLLRIAQVEQVTSLAPAVQNDTAFSIPWRAVTPASIPQFSGLCYYFGRSMFLAFAANTPIGLVEAAVGGTYIQSFMPPEGYTACNNTATQPPGWIGAPTGPGHPTSYVPWGKQNQPSALWNAMIHPLTPLTFKLAIFDQAEHNLAMREAKVFACLQEQLVTTWRAAWGPMLSFHDVQLPSYNMSEYWWIYLDPLGEMRLSQADTAARNTDSVTTTVTIDLADLTSPYGSVHNRQKQQVGHRVALNVLRAGYGRQLNAGPTLHHVSSLSGNTNLAAGPATEPTANTNPNVNVNVNANANAHNTTTTATAATAAVNSSKNSDNSAAGSELIIAIQTRTAVHAGPGRLGGTVDCVKCCAESAFETSVDGTAWSRTVAPAQPRLPTASGVVEIVVKGVPAGSVRWLRYGYDALVQCVYFDADGLPLGPFRVAVEEVTQEQI